MTTVAALYVETGGPYFGLEGVDPWDVTRDARLYAGPHPVVAHPPCKRWGRYWGGGPSARELRLMGDDGGCFDRALWAVRAFGGVLEHPEASHAWRWYGINPPARHGGWWNAGDPYGGMTTCVEQGHYGHRARKATWLYAVGTSLPELTWGPSEGKRLDDGFHTAEERRRALGLPDYTPNERLSSKQRLLTPEPFRDLLLELARSARD